MVMNGQHLLRLHYDFLICPLLIGVVRCSGIRRAGKVKGQIDHANNAAVQKQCKFYNHGTILLVGPVQQNYGPNYTIQN